MNFDFLDKFFYFSLENKNQSNFSKYFSSKYNARNMITDIDNIPVNKMNGSVYKKIKDFFITFNNDAQVQTFTENGYRRAAKEFKYLRIITEEDLIWLKYLSTVKTGNKTLTLKELENENELKREYKEKVLSQLEPKNICTEPVEWETFIKFVKEILSQNNLSLEKSDKKSEIKTLDELDKIFVALTDKLKARKFNFNLYQNLFKETKTSLLLNAIKYGVFIDKRDPDVSLIREDNNHI